VLFRSRVRLQEQSFNTIDIDERCVTVTVNGWKDDAFRPADGQRYEWQEGRWRILKTEEAAD